jgi:methylmalonyl-CoA mutase cobalamin-binding subunit
MKKLGIREIFGPGTTTEEIIRYVVDNLPKRD